MRAENFMRLFLLIIQIYLISNNIVLYQKTQIK